MCGCGVHGQQLLVFLERLLAFRTRQLLLLALSTIAPWPSGCEGPAVMAV